MSVDAADILNALGQHLLTMADCPPVIWPNKKPAALPDKPYLVAQIAGKNTARRAVSNGAKATTGQLIVTVVHDLDGYSTAADRLAQSVADQFDLDTPIPATGGQIRLRQEPTVVDGYSDDVSWRVPVVIPWRAK
ncbi:phage tail terminator-like protein [Pseudodonghicola flavimaris]|uniref:Phage tail terminator-like protein n=1 Tax=Pseudodonghicola flavimaris TaxID=3050036 RepID=A0ABT7EW24_9RHOB|nr:phage tail terminator-like protein [Pseudodonghicola flavimaris]MDK3016549.1 phage tail terminator-like protein [Pseudodonghicola flavimaris]